MWTVPLAKELEFKLKTLENTKNLLASTRKTEEFMEVLLLKKLS